MDDLYNEGYSRIRIVIKGLPDKQSLYRTFNDSQITIIGLKYDIV